MGGITSLTRMWLTRSVNPFLFRNEWDPQLPFAGCSQLGLYIHIPFCRQICHFCPYCKVLYEKERCERYVDALLEEIDLVGRQAEGKKQVTSLYFGGGTPALVADRLGEILSRTERYFTITQGIGVELHPENVTPPVLEALKEAGVTKLSIGVQSFRPKFQSVLGRSAVDGAELACALAAVPFETVSMDFIFALPGQTFEDLRSDIDAAFALGANHVAIYPFIDFTFTDSRVPAMPNGEKRRLLDRITAYCLGKGYVRTSIWTFSSRKGAVYSSMTRTNFLGFGCSAATLLEEQFKINTFSVEAYCQRLAAGQLPTALTLRFSRRQRMVYYLFWAAYGTRVDPREFEAFFGEKLEKQYGLELKLAQALGYLEVRDGTYVMTPKGAFTYHYYENFYTLSYIDKMWGILRKEAFPGEIRL